MKLTREEIAIVSRLEDLNARWPKSLKLFSRAGKLVILKPGKGRTIRQATVAELPCIWNDGGDPNENDPS
jgi:hypothetical protein